MSYSTQGSPKCDNGLQAGWYRFRGSAGTMMPASCVAKNKCGTAAPGWLQGRHPSPSEGAIQAKVCYHWNTCCDTPTDIRVRNCGAFYVYELKPGPGCTRYCGNGGQGVPNYSNKVWVRGVFNQSSKKQL